MDLECGLLCDNRPSGLKKIIPFGGWEWWPTPLIPEIGRQRQVGGSLSSKPGWFI